LGHNENDPKQILESLERWSGYATLWILAGIVVEIGALIWFPHSVEERIVGTIANCLIGVGLVAEYIVIGKAIIATREADRESEENVAKANQLAEEAKLETEQLKAQFAWRKISPQQEIILRRSLGELKGASVMIWVFMQDAETNNFALDLRAVFKLAGWRVSMSVAAYAGNFAHGIIVPMSSGETEMASEVIRKALTDASIDNEPLSIPEPYMHTDVDGNDGTPPWAEMYVGLKPMSVLG
jgi:hypothetical protein